MNLKNSNIFDGQGFAQELLEELKKEVETLEKKPTLAVVVFGLGHSVYIKKKEEFANFLGLGFKKYIFEEQMKTKEARRRLNLIVKSENINSIVVQLPLPKQINPAALNIIPFQKDPDFLSDRATGIFLNGRSKIMPPTAQAIVAILERAGFNLENKNVAVFGYGKLVGKFLVKMLLDKKARVRVAAHPMDDEKIKSFVAGADIVISSVGKPLFLNAELLPARTVVVDSGFSTSRVDGKVYGDVNFGTSQDKFSLVVPVSGGVGSVGVAILFRNVIKLSQL